MLRTIGQRAAHLIMVKATQKGISIDEECENIGTSRKVYRDWKKCGRNPSAWFLQQMYYAGYDVIWILTGGNNEENQ